MQSLLIECAVRSSLIAAFAAIVLFMMRVKAATARHAVWVGVIVVMLALPALVIWGPKVPLPILPHAGESATVLILPATDHFATPAVDPPRRSSQPLPQARGPEWVILLYLVGVLVFLIRLGIGAARMNALLRGRIACAAPVTVGWLRPKTILPCGWQQWPKAKLDAVLAHEREHARRRDPFWQLLALLNRAMFWFHPLAWWLEQKFPDWRKRRATWPCFRAVIVRVTIPNACWRWRGLCSKQALALALSASRCRAAGWSIAFGGC